MSEARESENSTGMTAELWDSPFMRACRREQVPYTPVWLMRQAGRYMKEYREIRARHTFLEMCKKLEFAKGEGPVIHNPVRSAEDLKRVREVEDVGALSYVFDAIRLTRRELRPD